MTADLFGVDSEFMNTDALVPTEADGFMGEGGDDDEKEGEGDNGELEETIDKLFTKLGLKTDAVQFEAVSLDERMGALLRDNRDVGLHRALDRRPGRPDAFATASSDSPRNASFPLDDDDVDVDAGLDHLRGDSV